MDVGQLQVHISLTLDQCSTRRETRRESCIFNTSVSIEANFVKYFGTSVKEKQLQSCQLLMLNEFITF